MKCVNIFEILLVVKFCNFCILCKYYIIIVNCILCRVFVLIICIFNKFNERNLELKINIEKDFDFE